MPANQILKNINSHSLEMEPGFFFFFKLSYRSQSLLNIVSLIRYNISFMTKLKAETHIMWFCKLSEFLLVDLLYSTPNHKPVPGCRQGFIKLPQDGPLTSKNLT